MKIYYCDWAQQPDIHITGKDGINEWTTPQWDSHCKYDIKSLPEGVYEAASGNLYTFNLNKVTIEPDKTQFVKS